MSSDQVDTSETAKNREWTRGMFGTIVCAILISYYSVWIAQYRNEVQLLDYQVIDQVPDNLNEFHKLIASKEHTVYFMRFQFSTYPIFAGLWVVCYSLFSGVKRIVNREYASAVVLLACVVSIWFFPFRVAPKIYEHGDKELATTKEELLANAQPVIDAIESYRAEHGTVPSNLDALVPKYFETIPLVGIAACPEYGYIPAGDNSYMEKHKLSGSLDVESYELNILLHRGGHFIVPYWLYYRPEQNYPKQDERFGNWAKRHYPVYGLFDVPPFDKSNHVIDPRLD